MRDKFVTVASKAALGGPLALLPTSCVATYPQVPTRLLGQSGSWIDRLGLGVSELKLRLR